MQHVEPVPQSFPWRRATLVVGAIAAVELLVLLGIAIVRLAPARAGAHPAAAAPGVTVERHAAPKAPPVPTHPLRARSAVHVLVLNGNGEQGAASDEASRLQVSGYRISGARNAARHDYARSMVLYVPGWVKEARRLGRDAGIRVVAPVDGLRPSMLKGSQLVVVLGTD
ncbi:MAG TPA: LytR C-terminal domain-containing protein [Gaiellaceae bacterium]|nr:LytR C-terminal domain-containing protein [Gaiellaceae bacterium]